MLDAASVSVAAGGAIFIAADAGACAPAISAPAKIAVMSVFFNIVTSPSVTFVFSVLRPSCWPPVKLKCDKAEQASVKQITRANFFEFSFLAFE